MLVAENRPGRARGRDLHRTLLIERFEYTEGVPFVFVGLPGWGRRKAKVREIYAPALQ